LIDVLGASSGGRISLSTQGRYAGLQRLDVDQGSSLLAQGSGAGNGGDIEITSAGQTVFDGTAVVSGDRNGLREIYASGKRADSGLFGRRSRVTPLGEGGNITLAGLTSLVVSGEIDASSAMGASKGSVRFDAGEVMVGSRQIRSRLAGAVMPRVGMIDAKTLSGALNGADVTIVARGKKEFGKCGSIHVGGPVIWHANSALTLKAAGDVSVHDTIRATGKYASLRRHAGRPFLPSVAGRGNTQDDVTMMGARAASRSIRLPVVPRLTDNAVASIPSGAAGKYSVAASARIADGRVAPPVPLSYASVISRSRNKSRGSISQISRDRNMPVRPGVNELLTEASPPAHIAAREAVPVVAQIAVQDAVQERAQPGQHGMQREERRPDVQLGAVQAGRVIPSPLAPWWTRRNDTPVSLVAYSPKASAVADHADRRRHVEQADPNEQLTPTEVSAFNVHSPSVGAITMPIEYQRLRISIPGEIDEEGASL
jgi:hypothetical protein